MKKKKKTLVWLQFPKANEEEESLNTHRNQNQWVQMMKIKTND